MNVVSAAEKALRESIIAIHVRSRLHPEIIIRDPFVETPAGPSRPPSGEKKTSLQDRAGQLIRPMLYVRTRVSDRPIVVAPWGEPERSYHRELAAGGVAVGALALYGLWTLLQ